MDRRAFFAATAGLLAAGQVKQDLGGIPVPRDIEGEIIRRLKAFRYTPASETERRCTRYLSAAGNPVSR